MLDHRRLNSSDPMNGSLTDRLPFIDFPTNVFDLFQRCLSESLDYYTDDISQSVSWRSSGNSPHPRFSKLILATQQVGTASNQSAFDSNCPALYAQSTIAHASFAVAMLATMIHLILVFAFNGGLLRLYGPCLLTSMCFSVIHNGLLFTSFHMTSSLQLFDTRIEAKSLNHSEVNPLVEMIHQPWSICWTIDLLLHTTSLTIHLSIFFGLVEKLTQVKRDLADGSGFRNRDILFKPVRKQDTLQISSSLANNNVDSHRQQHGSSYCSRQSDRGKMNLQSSAHRSRSRDWSSNLHDRSRPYSSGRKHRCLPRALHLDWNWLGPPLSIFLPLLATGLIGWQTNTDISLTSMWNPAYGIVTCGGGVGSCLAAYQWYLYLPLGGLMAGQLTLIAFLSSASKHPSSFILGTGQASQDQTDIQSQTRMYSKLIGSHVLVWITAFLSNYVCLVTLWQLYAIFSGLQSLFLIVSFTFSRPFLEVFFKRNDPYGRLKLDTLVMNMPLGISKHGSTQRGFYGAAPMSTFVVQPRSQSRMVMMDKYL